MSDVLYMPDVQMLVDGLEHEGWQEATITQSLEGLATTFQLKYSDIWLDQIDEFSIGEGAKCELYIDGERLMIGHVDSMVPSYTPDDHSISATGRSLTGDLVDCSCVAKIRRYRGKTVGEICADMTEPFGISVIDESGDSPELRAYTVDPGTRAFDAMREAAQRRGLVLIDRDGDLVVTKIASEASATILGREILADGREINHGDVLIGSRPGDWAQRFSEYRWRGQTGGTDDLSGTAAAHNTGAVFDDTLVAAKRYRPTVITGRGQGAADLKTRAIFERNRRAGRSERVLYTVSGWFDGGGVLWRVNRMVQVIDDFLRVRAPMLIVGVTYTIRPADSQYGVATALELARPEAFGAEKYPVRAPAYEWKVVADV